MRAIYRAAAAGGRGNEFAYFSRFAPRKFDTLEPKTCGCPKPLLLTAFRGTELSSLGSLADFLEDVIPSFRHTIAILSRDFPQRSMCERDSGSSAVFDEAILYMIDSGKRHEHWAPQLQKLGRLDDLNMAP